MDNLTNVSLKVFINLHHSILNLKCAIEGVLQRIHDKLIITHATICLRHGYYLIILIAKFILHDNLNRETTGTNANGSNCYLLVHWLYGLTESVTINFCVYTIYTGLGKQFLTHKLLSCNVHITKICQSWHTEFAIAIVIKRAAWDLVIIHLIIITKEIHAPMTIRTLTLSFVCHNLMTK